MRPRAVTLVAAGQVCLVVLLGVCVATHPGLVLKGNEGGVSNYGVRAASVVPYSLAYALDAAALALAARRLGPAARALRAYLNVLALLLVATLATTYGYTGSTARKDLHFVVGAALVLSQCAGAPWLARAARRGLAGAALLAVGAGLAACVLASLGVWHVLFAGQALVIAGSATLLVAATRAASP